MINKHMHRKILLQILNYSCISHGLAEYCINFNTSLRFEGQK